MNKALDSCGVLKAALLTLPRTGRSVGRRHGEVEVLVNVLTLAAVTLLIALAALVYTAYLLCVTSKVCVLTKPPLPDFRSYQCIFTSPTHRLTMDAVPFIPLHGEPLGPDRTRAHKDLALNRSSSPGMKSGVYTSGIDEEKQKRPGIKLSTSTALRRSPWRLSFVVVYAATAHYSKPVLACNT
jgi:hypothetical protein